MSVILGRINEAVMVAIGILLGLFFFTLLVRRRWIAVGLVLTFFAFNAASLPASNPPLQALVTTSVVSVLLFGLLRLGLLTLVVSIFTTNLLGAFALTLDPSPWYAGFGYLVMAVVLGLSVLAFWRATPVRTLVGQMLSE